MATIEVIYDPVKEYGAIINTDTGMAWGPAMNGPVAGELLQGWVDAMPFDVTILDQETAGRVFGDFLEELVKGAEQVPSTAPTSAVEPPSADGLGHDALAQAEASAAGGEPPEPQPADTDPEADQGTEATWVTCPLCQGAKQVVDVDTGEATDCGMCGQTGVIKMAVPS